MESQSMENENLKKDEIINVAKELEKSLPESQANTRSEITQKILDFAALIYKVEKYSDSLESGKYISWLQDLGVDGYNASKLLNSPKRAFDELKNSDFYKKSTT